jgi:hypothetical protein
VARPECSCLWNAFVNIHTASNWTGVGGKDTITLHNGAVFKREVIEWIDGSSITLKVADHENDIIFVEWIVSKTKENHSNLKIIAYVPFTAELPKIILTAVYNFKIKPHFLSYLESSVQKFSFYIMTGKRVESRGFTESPLQFI